MRPLPPTLFTLAALACAPRSGSCSSPSPTPTLVSSPPAASTPAAPAPPPSLAPAEALASAIASARAALGPTAPARTEHDVFILIAERPGPFFDASVALAHKALEAYFHDRFTTPPAVPITVFVFPSAAPCAAFCRKRLADSSAVAKCGTTLGVYRPSTRELYANLEALTTLTHELVHPIVHTDFPHAPIWIDEGIASLFETPVFPGPGEIHGATNPRRLPLLRASLRSRDKPDTFRLDALFGMSEARFHVDELAHYALARFACQWLDEHGQLWPFYRAWRDGFVDDPTGEKSFTRVVGMSPSDAQAGFEAWVRGL